MPKFLVNIDLNQNEIQNVSLQKLTIAPSNPTKGQVYYNTVDNRSYYWNGNSWVGMDSFEATMSAENIVTAINGSTFLIDDDNLSENVNSAITNSHTHTNSAVLANTTASFLETQETKLGYISVTQAVDLDSMETNITTNNAKVTNATHTGDVTGSGKLTIENKAVTLAKMADMATASLLGRKTASAGSPEVLSKTDVLSLLNVEDGANKYTHPNHSGDVTSTGDGATLIVNNAVNNDKLADMAINTIKGRKTSGTGDPEDLSADDVRTILNVDNGANNYSHPTGDGNLHVPVTGTTNNDKFLKAGATAGSLTWSVVPVVSVAGKTGAITLSKSDVQLSDVTNNAQIKKRASSTIGHIPTWDVTTGDSLDDGFAVETTLIGASSAIPRADAVKTYVDSLLGANDAMVFKGTIGTGGTITTLPETHSAGWTYKVITASTYAGHICEIGDMLIAVVDRAGTGNLDTDWTAIQTNIDGAVIGAPSSTNGNFPIFSGTTGKLIANSSYSPTSFATAVHSHGTYDRASGVLTGATVFSNIEVTDGIVTNIATRDLTPASIGASPSNHTHTYTSKFSADLGGSTSQLVTHNLNTQDVVITIRDKTTNEQVITDVEFTSVNTLTVKFAVAPSAGQYRITIVG